MGFELRGAHWNMYHLSQNEISSANPNGSQEMFPCRNIHDVAKKQLKKAVTKWKAVVPGEPHGCKPQRSQTYCIGWLLVQAFF